MSLVNISKLRNYLNNKINVMLIGTHGVGKTEIIRQVFNGAGLNWRYFSAATMDPWVDFIGVPRSVEREGKTDVLKLVKPEDFEDDLVEAIFFDEFNRAPQKVTNAVMELIQFKSINGRVFKNLKVIWTAINPHDEENTYHVEKMDPAVMDRFQVKITIPNELDKSYFIGKYGVDSLPFMKWWNELPIEMKTVISPRRLDYAINIFNIMGELEDVLPKESNLDKLKTYIKNNDNGKVLKDIANKSSAELTAFFTLENTAKWWGLLMAVENKELLSKVFDYLNPEYVAKEFEKNVGTKKLLDLIKTSKNKKMNHIDDKLVNFGKSLSKKEVKKDATFLDAQKNYVALLSSDDGEILPNLIREYTSNYLIKTDLKDDSNKVKGKNEYYFAYFLTEEFLPKVSLDEMYRVSKNIGRIPLFYSDIIAQIVNAVGSDVTNSKQVSDYIGQFYGISKYILKRLAEIDSANIVKMATVSTLKVNKNIWDELIDTIPQGLSRGLNEGLKKANAHIEKVSPSLIHGVELPKKLSEEENLRNKNLFKKIEIAKSNIDVYRKSYKDYLPLEEDYKKSVILKKLKDIEDVTSEENVWDKFNW